MLLVRRLEELGLAPQVRGEEAVRLAQRVKGGLVRVRVRDRDRVRVRVRVRV